MSRFERNQNLMPAMRQATLERARDAGQVLVRETRDIIEPGSPSDRSEPGQPPASQSGELENSIEELNHRADGSKLNVRIGTNLIKAWWLEFGTATMAPRPFMRPALANARGTMLAQFKNVAGRASQ